MKKIILFLVIIMFWGAKNFAQTDIPQLLEAGIEDANTLASPYLESYGEMLGASLNNGWYSSAKVHKTGGFDITFTLTYVKSVSAETSFDLSKIILNEFELKPGSPTLSPTIAGDLENRPILQKKDDPSNSITFEMPNGTGMDYLPIPMITAGVGLPYGIEVRGRYSPKIEIGEAGKLGVWGIGLHKDLKNHIPGLKEMPVLNLSVMAAYTHFGSEMDVTQKYGKGMLDIKSNAFTTRLLIGANLPVVAFYTGLGYGKSNSDFDLLGTYRLGNEIPLEFIDPIQVGYSTATFDMNIGVRVRLGIITLHADYTIGKYNALTGGLGINFR